MSPRSLKPHQLVNRDLIFDSLRAHYGALDASETGTGKSTTFLAVCRMLDARPAIITRKTIIPGWHDECRAMGVEPLFITNYEAARSSDFPFGRVRVVSERKNPSTGRVEPMREYEWNVSGRVLFQFDEVQACRAQKTLNTKMLLAAASRYKVCMASATPFTSPREAYGIGLTLRLFKKSDWWRWQLRHGVRKNFAGHMEWIGDSPDPRNRARGLELMSEIHEAIFPSRGCRTRRSEIPGFPEELTLIESIEVENPGAIERAYLEVIAEARRMDLARAKEGVPEDLHDLVEVLPVTQALRARQEAELHKVSAILELAHMAREKGESVAIFVNFDNTIEALRRMLETNSVIRGERPGDGRDNLDRARVVRNFQENKSWVVIVNNAAGGAGVNLHDPVTQKPRTCLISPPWSAVVLKQVLGRTQRLGGGFSTRRLLFAAGTIEERVMGRVRNKMDCLDMLTDGDLDVAVVAHPQRALTA